MYLCVSLFTYVLVSHVPFFILIHLCSQISFCLSYLFSHPQLLSDTLSLCMKQGQMTIRGNKITYLTISWTPSRSLKLTNPPLCQSCPTLKICILAGPSSFSGMAILNAPFRPNLRSASRESSGRWWVVQYLVSSEFKTLRFSSSALFCCTSASSWYILNLSVIH